MGQFLTDKCLFLPAFTCPEPLQPGYVHFLFWVNALSVEVAAGSEDCRRKVGISSVHCVLCTYCAGHSIDVVFQLIK